MNKNTATVGDYMVRDIQWVTPNMTVMEVKDKIIKSNFHGFPIVENRYLLGYVTAKELLNHIDRPDARIREVMRRGTICAVPTMSIDDATRILFRYGLRNLPIVDEEKRIIGIISNIDVVRSQIEKSKPEKVQSVKKFLESQNNIHLKEVNEEVEISKILPTQKEVFMDELIGRQYELKRGLNEPLILIKRRDGYIVVDGHHRVMAAKRMNMRTFNAVVLVPDDMDVRLGLERTAEKWGLRTLDDVNVIEGAKHPFMEITTMLLPKEDAAELNERLVQSSKANPHMAP